MNALRKGVLIQGSLELGEWPGLDHGVIEKEFLLLIASDFNESISTKEWPDGLEADRLSLVNTYSSNSWTQGRRAPDREIQRIKVSTFSTCLVWGNKSKGWAATAR